MLGRRRPGDKCAAIMPELAARHSRRRLRGISESSGLELGDHCLHGVVGRRGRIKAGEQ